MIERRRTVSGNVCVPVQDDSGSISVEGPVVGPVARNGMSQTRSTVEERTGRDQEIAAQRPIGRRRDPGGVAVGDGQRIERERAASETDPSGSPKNNCSRARKDGTIQV